MKPARTTDLAVLSSLMRIPAAFSQFIRQSRASGLAAFALIAGTMMAPLDSARAFTTVASESFEYTAGSLETRNGGSGWTSAWSFTYSGSMQVNTTGLTYSGLTTAGGKTIWGGTGTNEIRQAERTLPLMEAGVVYLQFLSQFGTSGGGTPQMRLMNGSSNTGALGANGGTKMGILGADLNAVANTDANLNVLNLVVVRIDYTAVKTEMWVNPNLSTFNYSSPPAAHATANGLAPKFNKISLYGRSPDAFDEILVRQLVTTTPTDITLSPASIAENNAPNATVGTLSATDTGAGPHTFAFVSGTGDTDNASFSISGSTLSIIPVADFETKSSYSIRVRTTNPGGQTFDKALTVSITDVNEAPSFGSSYQLAYETVTPVRSSNNIIYSVNNAAALSALSFDRVRYRMETRVDGVLRYAETTFDAWGGLTVAGLRVPTPNDPFILQRNVTNLSVESNYAGVVNASAQTGRLEIWNNNYSTTASGGVGGSSSLYDFDDTPTVGSHGSFQVHNLSSAPPQTVMAWNNHGVVTPQVGFGNSPVGNPDWTHETGLSLTDWKLQIYVGSDGANGLNFTVTEDVTSNLLFSGTPFRDDSPTLTVTLAVADGTITGNAGTGITVGGTATARTFTGSVANLNTYFTTAGKITYLGALNNTTSRTLTITVSDGSFSTEGTSTINFIPVNDTPTDIALSASTIAENVAANTTVGTLSTTDPDAGDTFTYTLVSGTGSDDNASFNINGASLRISSSPNFEVKNSYTVRVRSTDAGGLFYEKAFTITISNVNEMPGFTKGADQLLPYATSAAQSVPGWATAIDDGDSTVVQGLTFNVGNNNNGLFSVQPAVSSTGTLTFTPNGTAGSATVTVSLTDDNTINGTPALTTAGQTFTITVQATPNYTVTTTGSAIVVTDLSGNADTLAVSEPVAGSIQFAAAGRTFSVDGGLHISGNSGALSHAAATSITVNAGAGADTVNIGAFASTLPSLTVNGGSGNDVVNLNGDLTFAADASLDLDLQNDHATPGMDTLNVAANANIIASGTGSITIKVSRNVSLNTGSSLETVNGAILIEANTQTVASTGSFAGVLVDGALIRVSGTAACSVTGRGGDSGTRQSGIAVTNGGDIIGGTLAPLTLVGTGGPSLSAENPGIRLDGEESSITSAGGAVSVTGQGGGSGSGYNCGIWILNSATLSAGGEGALTLVGTGGQTAGNFSYGLLIQSAATITSGGGNVTVTGHGGKSVGNTSTGGIYLESSLISAGGTGSVTVTGIADTTGDSSVRIGIDIRFTAEITSSGGDVSVTGYGGPSNYSIVASGSGVRIFGDGHITAGGTGNVHVTGHGGMGSTATHQGISLDGHGLGTNMPRIGTANGTTTITASAPNGLSPALVIGDSTNGGRLLNASSTPIIIQADSISIGSAGVIGSGTATTSITGLTTGTAINIGGADVLTGSPLTLGLTDAELDRITAGTVIVGDADSGTIRITSAISPLNYSVLSIGKAVEFTATGGFSPQISSAIVYQSMEVAGSITLQDGAALTPYVVGGYEPVPLTVFPLVRNTTASDNSGQFVGMAEGQPFTLAGLVEPMTVSYKMGPGENDIAVHKLQPQSIAFSPILNLYEDDSLDLTAYAVATSGLPVSYSVASGPGLLSGNILSFTGPGTVSVVAHQYGDETHAPALDVSRSIESLPVPISTGVAESWRVVNGGPESVLIRRDGTARAIAMKLNGDEAEEIVATGSSTNAQGNTDIFTAKYDAETGADIWSVTHAGTAGRNDEGVSVAVDSGGNVIIAGTVTNAAGNTDIYVAKYADADGTLMWEATYAGDGTQDFGHDGIGIYDAVNMVQKGRSNLQIGPSDEVIVGGYIASSATNRDLVLIKFDAAGARQWVATYDGPAQKADHSNSVVIDEAGDVFVAGASIGTNMDAITLKYAGLDGALLWEQRYDDGKPDEAVKIDLDRLGNPIIGGYSQQTNYDFLTVTYDSATGAVLYSRVLDGPMASSDAAWDMAVVDGEHIILTGASYSAAGAFDGYTVRLESAVLDSAMPAKWGTLFSGVDGRQDQMVAIGTDRYGNPVVTGYGQNADGSYDAYTAKYDALTGATVWQTQMDGPGLKNDFPRDIAVDPAGNVFVAGFAASPSGSTDFWVSRYLPTVAEDERSQVITFTQPTTQNYGTSMTLRASASSGLPVTYTVTEGPATVLGDVLHFTGIGSVTVQATQAGDEDYDSAAPVERTFEVIKGRQIIAFPLPASGQTLDVVPLNAYSSSALPVSYEWVSGPGVILDDELTFTGAGTVTLRVSQAGNEFYDAAADVQRSIVIGLIPQSLTFTAPASLLRTDTLALGAVTSSGLPVTYEVLSGPGVISDGTLSFTAHGSVTVRASQAGNAYFAAATAVQRIIKVANIRPVLSPVVLADCMVSQPVSYSLSASMNPTRYAATGLPPGVKMNSVTGVLSGIPTAPKLVLGVAVPYTVTFTASNSAGASLPVIISWMVHPLHAAAVGTFNGLADASTTLSFDNATQLSGLGGRITITTAARGTFSGSLALETKAHSFSGKLASVSTVSNVTGTAVIKRGTGIPNLALQFTIDKDTGGLTGTLDDGRISTPVALSAWRNSWVATTNPATVYARTYTAGLELPPLLQGDQTFPQGHGYGTLTVTTAGVTRWVGRMADGTAVSIASTLGPQGQVPLYLRLYTSVNTTAGSVRGWLNVTPGTPNGLDGQVTWIKQAQTVTTRLYQGGFPAHTLTVLGGVYVAPSGIVLDLPNKTGNARLFFAEGGLSEAALTQATEGVHTQAFRITATNTVTMPPLAQNPGLVSLSLNKLTGAISGRFTVKDPNPVGTGIVSRIAYFYGVLIPGQNRGVGYFTLGQLPSTTPTVTTLTTSPQLSGQVILEANP